jgi:hypothetical protein
LIWYYGLGVDHIDLVQPKSNDWADRLDSTDGGYMEQVATSASIVSTAS